MKDQTTLFTKTPRISFQGLYEPFKNKDEIIQHVAEWVNESSKETQ